MVAQGSEVVNLSVQACRPCGSLQAAREGALWVSLPRANVLKPEVRVSDVDAA